MSESRGFGRKKLCNRFALAFAKQRIWVESEIDGRWSLADFFILRFAAVHATSSNFAIFLLGVYLGFMVRFAENSCRFQW